jgi:hypothetical protein
MVEAHVAGAPTPDWLVGSPPAFVTPLRNMQNPGSISTIFGPYPSRYSQRIQTTEDNGGVHLNSSIVNHAFYQLVQGLPNAIGRPKAQAIFYRALTAHLTASANFVDARIAAVTSAQELSGSGITAADVQAVRDAFTAVEVFDGAGTEPPDPFPGTDGTDSTLFVRFVPGAGANFLGRREIPSDGANGGILSTFDVKAARPAVLGDGSEAVFVDSIDGLCFISTAGGEPEFCDERVSGAVSSVAVSPDGHRFSFVLRDLVSGDPENQIYVLDERKTPPDDLSIFSIEAPAIDAATIANILFADQMDFSADGRLMIFDAITEVGFLGSGAGTTAAVRVWAIYAVDLATGTIFTIVPPERGVDIGYPALAQTSDIHLVFDVVEQETGNGAVLAGNLDTGALAKIADLAGTPSSPAFGIPSYSGSDDAVILSYADATVPSGVSLARQGVASDRITPSGAPTAWLDDADFGVIYRRGTFVPEPASTWLVACAWSAVATLARRRPARAARRSRAES